jgi:hypothetical protein
MATADCMAPKAGKRVIFVLAVPGQRSCSRQKEKNLRRRDGIAGSVPIGISEELT